QAYGLPSFAVDAMNVEDAHEAVAAAAERARRGHGPSLLAFRTYRSNGHSISDPQKSRTREEEEEYKSKAPIDLVRNTITDNHILTTEEIEAITAKVKKQVEDAVRFAEESPWPDGEDAFVDVYMQEDYPFVRE